MITATLTYDELGYNTYGRGSMTYPIPLAMERYAGNGDDKEYGVICSKYH